MSFKSFFTKKVLSWQRELSMLFSDFSNARNVSGQLFDPDIRNQMIKFNQRIFLIGISVLACVLELILLVNVFPQTGLGRIVYIPFWIIIFFFVSILFTKNKRPLKKVIFSLTIVHLILFHIMLWSWPQSAAIKKNLVEEFYGKVYK